MFIEASEDAAINNREILVALLRAAGLGKEEPNE
jgi:hypothetical protein